MADRAPLSTSTTIFLANPKTGKLLPMDLSVSEITGAVLFVLEAKPK